MPPVYIGRECCPALVYAMEHGRNLLCPLKPLRSNSWIIIKVAYIAHIGFAWELCACSKWFMVAAERSQKLVIEIPASALSVQCIRPSSPCSETANASLRALNPFLGLLPSLFENPSMRYFFQRGLQNIRKWEEKLPLEYKWQWNVASSASIKSRVESVMHDAGAKVRSAACSFKGGFLTRASWISPARIKSMVLLPCHCSREERPETCFILVAHPKCHYPALAGKARAAGKSEAKAAHNVCARQVV